MVGEAIALEEFVPDRRLSTGGAEEDPGDDEQQQENNFHGIGQEAVASALGVELTPIVLDNPPQHPGQEDGDESPDEPIEEPPYDRLVTAGGDDDEKEWWWDRTAKEIVASQPEEDDPQPEREDQPWEGGKPTPPPVPGSERDGELWTIAMNAPLGEGEGTPPVPTGREDDDNPDTPPDSQTND